MISVFHRENVCSLQDRMLEALKPLEKEFGVCFTKDGGNFNPDTATLKFSVARNVNGQKKTAEQIQFEKNCIFYGLNPSDYNRKILLRWRDGALYPAYIVGLKLRSRKHPIIIKWEEDGKRFRYSEETIQQAIKRTGE